MKVIQNEQIIMCDVDFTLLLWDLKDSIDTIKFIDPYTGQIRFVAVHRPNLKLLTSRLARGATVFVWSASGHAWAKAAMDALELDHENLFVLSKPIGYIDDKPCQDWMGERIFLPEDYTWR